MATSPIWTKAKQSGIATGTGAGMEGPPGGSTPDSVSNVMRIRNGSPAVQQWASAAKMLSNTGSAAPVDTGDGMPSMVDGELRMSPGDINTIKKRQNAAPLSPGAKLLGT